MEKILAQKNFVNSRKDFIPTKNDSPYERILAIGDVHGAFNKLVSLLKTVKAMMGGNIFSVMRALRRECPSKSRAKNF